VDAEERLTIQVVHRGVLEAVHLCKPQRPDLLAQVQQVKVKTVDLVYSTAVRKLVAAAAGLLLLVATREPLVVLVVLVSPVQLLDLVSREPVVAVLVCGLTWE
jgi:hypothetical protein